MLPVPLINAIYTLIIAGLSSVIAYFTIDTNIANWAWSFLKNDWAIRLFAKIPEVTILFVLVAYPVCAIRYCYERYTHMDHVLFAMANSVAIAYSYSQFLRPSYELLPPFHIISGHLFFISNYSAVTIAASTILFVAYPLLRMLITFVSFLAVVGLIGGCHCFVSGAVAGGALGFIIANFIVDISNIEHIKNEGNVLG